MCVEGGGLFLQGECWWACHSAGRVFFFVNPECLCNYTQSDESRHENGPTQTKQSRPNNMHHFVLSITLSLNTLPHFSGPSGSFFLFACRPLFSCLPTCLSNHALFISSISLHPCSSSAPSSSAFMPPSPSLGEDYHVLLALSNLSSCFASKHILTVSPTVGLLRTCYYNTTGNACASLCMEILLVLWQVLWIHMFLHCSRPHVFQSVMDIPYKSMGVFLPLPFIFGSSCVFISSLLSFILLVSLWTQIKFPSAYILPAHLLKSLQLYRTVSQFTITYSNTATGCVYLLVQSTMVQLVHIRNFFSEWTSKADSHASI